MCSSVVYACVTSVRSVAMTVTKASVERFMLFFLTFEIRLLLLCGNKSHRDKNQTLTVGGGGFFFFTAKRKPASLSQNMTA